MPKKDLLKTYARKRDFRKTAEPAGHVVREKGDTASFVIQKHDASHLHYDFRLEAEGVLKSWAVPKGPSLDPKVKRLAMQTEDHPLDYASFEGTIPKGQYGGGTVMVWDNGTYENHSHHNGRPISLVEGLRRGHVSFDLHGKKLRGGFSLTRIQNGAKPSWLLVKQQDSDANRGDPVQTKTESALTRRSLDQIAHADRAAGVEKKIRQKTAEKSPFPQWVEPMLATLTDRRFSDTDWIYEPKLDGERCLIYRNGDSIKLFSRRKLSLNHVYPELVEAIRAQSLKQFILDGEVVAFEPGDPSKTSFARLQTRMHVSSEAEARRSKVPIFFFAFDLLYLSGVDLRKGPLKERKKLLEAGFTFKGPFRFMTHRDGGGEDYFKEACRQGWEGLIAKRGASTYQPGRSKDWLKFKCVSEQEFVIGGYTDPEGAREHFGALLMGYYNGDKLMYAGKVGTGYDAKMLALLNDAFAKIPRDTRPFAPDPELQRRHVHWLEPKLVAQVAFSQWTPSGKLRMGRFQGLRRDKAPIEVTRELPAA